MKFLALIFCLFWIDFGLNFTKFLLFLSGLHLFLMMSQGRILRNSPEAAKQEEILEQKLLEFGKKLATKEDIAEIKNLFTKLHERLDVQEKRITSLEEDSVHHEERIVQLENTISELKTTVNHLCDKNAVLSSSVDFLTRQSDNHEQYSRRYCLRINGIEKMADESAPKCVEKVVEICNNLNLDISSSDIDRAHRVGREKQSMIVKFHSFGKRTALYKARKNLPNQNIKIRLDITKARLDLLDQAKALIVNDGPVDFVFADINCNCVARLKSKTYKFFNDIESFKRNILNKE